METVQISVSANTTERWGQKKVMLQWFGMKWNTGEKM